MAIVGVAVIYCLCILDKRTKKNSIQLPSIHVGTGMISANPPATSGNISLPADIKDRLKKLQFTFAEVLQITSDLRIKLGEGGFGPVYHGKMEDGSPVAVKRLSLTSLQGTEEFLNEVEILSRAHHKNVLSLVGYCCELKERCLIYKFMPKGTLEDCLHGLPSEQEPLDWLARLKIAVDAAKGFSYLHNDCYPAIIHRDVKSSNILLDNKLVAKVADFGLSKLLTKSALTHITTQVKGTFGYFDPEYAQTERLTEKSDVYGFGIILLELISGNKAVIQREGEYIHIAQWAKPHIMNRRLPNIVDKNLGNTFDMESVQAVGNIALKCVSYKSINRPFFKEVLQLLEAALKLELPLEAHSEVSSVETASEHSAINGDTVIPIIGDPKPEEESPVSFANWT